MNRLGQDRRDPARLTPLALELAREQRRGYLGPSGPVLSDPCSAGRADGGSRRARTGAR